MQVLCGFNVVVVNVVSCVVDVFKMVVVIVLEGEVIQVFVFVFKVILEIVCKLIIFV